MLGPKKKKKNDFFSLIEEFFLPLIHWSISTCKTDLKKRDHLYIQHINKKKIVFMLMVFFFLISWIRWRRSVTVWGLTRSWVGSACASCWVIWFSLVWDIGVETVFPVCCVFDDLKSAVRQLDSVFSTDDVTVGYLEKNLGF